MSVMNLRVKLFAKMYRFLLILLSTEDSNSPHVMFAMTLRVIESDKCTIFLLILLTTEDSNKF